MTEASIPGAGGRPPRTHHPPALAGAEGARLVKTRWGWACAAWTDGKLTALSLPHPTRAAALVACGRTGATVARPAAPGQLGQLAQDLRRYFAGQVVDLSRYPADLSSLPGFVQRALLAARGIPYGQVRTYGWVAARAGNGRAARAAGQAMSRNPVALLVPCHRVVGAGGRLTGFGGGLPMKRALLELEGVACRRDRVVPRPEGRDGGPEGLASGPSGLATLGQRQSLARRRR